MHKRITSLAGLASAVGILAVAPGASGEDLPGDRPVPFWPHETGALMGTSETFVDVRDDSSYYDPSIGRRVVVAQINR